MYLFMVLAMGGGVLALAVPRLRGFGHSFASLAVCGFGLVWCAALIWRVRRDVLYHWEEQRKGLHRNWLTRRAAILEEAGEINERRIYWFTVSATGFVEISELHQRQAGLVSSEYRETRGPWTALTDIVVEERHVFLCTANGGAFILPIRSFRDASAVADFVQTVRDFQEAACRAAAGVITASPEDFAGGRAVR